MNQTTPTNASTAPPTGDLMATAAFHFEQMKPMLPLYIHLILSALFPIVTGSFSSLSRPSTAGKPKKADKEADDGEGDEDEEHVQKMEGLSAKDAIVLPVTAGCVLAGLYWLIKRYGADPINLILGWYFSGVGIFSVGKIINDAAALVLSVVFPTYFAHKGKLWTMNGTERKASVVGDGPEKRDSPLPGFLGLVPLPRTVNNTLWSLRSISKQKYDFKAYVKGVLDANGPFTLLNVAAAFASLGAIGYNHFIDKPWWLTNLQGFAVSYTALQVMSPTTFATGSLILSGLFFYDIWAVFFTPLMVTVAKNLDQPIKLLFPRPDVPGAEGQPPTKSFSMLGLGDIVLPGLMIGLALRFDLHMYFLKQQKTVTKVKADGKSGEEVVKADYHNITGQWGSRIWTYGLDRSSQPKALDIATFPKPYFIASLVGYVAGMIATLAVMSIWQHAQPALLYLVPGVLLSIWSTALVRGEIKQLWDYAEDVSGEAADEGDEKAKDRGDKDKAKEPESWLDYAKYEIIGLSRPSASGDKTGDDASGAKDKKPEDVLDRKAAEDPDGIFSISIRRQGRTSKKATAAGASEEHEEASSQTSSEDAVLVSKDAEKVTSQGATKRKGRSKKA